jgi:predicted aspartyl protease
VEGKIDTGSDLCTVPERLIAGLDLPPVRTVRAVGFAGTGHEVVVYRADFELDGLRVRHVEAIATQRPYALLGRNLLRYLVVRLDGPRAELQLRRPRA